MLTFDIWNDHRLDVMTMALKDESGPVYVFTNGRDEDVVKIMFRHCFEYKGCEWCDSTERMYLMFIPKK